MFLRLQQKVKRGSDGDDNHSGQVEILCCGCDAKTLSCTVIVRWGRSGSLKTKTGRSKSKIMFSNLLEFETALKCWVSGRRAVVDFD